MTTYIRNNKHMFTMMALALFIFAFVGMVMVSTAAPAFCANDAASDIQGAFSDMTEKIYKVMRAIIIPCCIVALAFAGFQFLVGGSQGAEKARKIVIAVVLAVCFVVFAPIAVNTIGGMVKDSGNGDWGNYNPLVDATETKGNS